MAKIRVGLNGYGRLTGPYLPGSLPLPAAFYGVLVWPFLWGLTEQMTYNGYQNMRQLLT